jgi:hypothetical protein
MRIRFLADAKSVDSKSVDSKSVDSKSVDSKPREAEPAIAGAREPIHIQTASE